MTRNNPFLKKVSTTSPAGHANPKPLCGTPGNVYSRLLQSSAMPRTRGQRYSETNDCQTPIKNITKLANRINKVKSLNGY